MPWFLPALAATATAAFARKVIARYWHGVHAQHAQADPPGLRTVARFSADTPGEVMAAIARSLGRDFPVEITADAIRAQVDEDIVDVVRLARRDLTWTVELTRAWTGVYLGEQTRHVLALMDALGLRRRRRVVAPQCVQQVGCRHRLVYATSAHDSSGADDAGSTRARRRRMPTSSGSRQRSSRRARSTATTSSSRCPAR